MKKVIVGLMVILAASVASASSVNWSVNAIQSSPSVKVTTGWLVQVYTSDVTYSYDSALAGSIKTWDSAATVTAGATYRVKDTGEQTAGTSVSYYAVIYDAGSVASAKNYIVSELATVITAAGGQTATLNFGAMTGATEANKFLDSEWQAVPGGDTPEPTSGLLLMVGGALLALRRKQK